MIEKLKNILNEINIYGLDFNLLYRKEKTYSTLFDVLLSLLYLSLLIIVSVIYFSDIFSNKGFSLITNTIELNKGYTINLSNTNFFFTLSYYSGEFIDFDPSYITFKIFQTEFDILNNPNIPINELENVTELKYEECSYSNKENLNLSSLNFNKALCISNRKNLIISGSFGDIIFGYKSLIVEFGKCINSSYSNITCKSNEQIEQYLSNIKFNVIYNGYTIDHYNVIKTINSN
jgi:hypothetical protein